MTRLTENSLGGDLASASLTAEITERDGFVQANLYVNARNVLDNADITTLRWTGSTVAGAKRWAAKQLAA